MERLGILEESLLTLSRIDAGTLPLEHSKVDIYTALTLAADNLSDLLQKENVSVSIPDKGCIEVTGDMEWTMEAFLNLIKTVWNIRRKAEPYIVIIPAIPYIRKF